MAFINKILKETIDDLSDDQKEVYFHTANRAGEILAACILAEAVGKLGESIERALSKSAGDQN